MALATNAAKPLIRRVRHYIAPVYDYCMVTEPLTPAQLESIGWRNRQGLSDIPNQFHYYRLTSDNRILWGGYDAVYYWRRQGVGGTREPAGVVGDAQPATSSRRSPSSKTSSSRTRGVARSTPAAASACSGVGRSTVAVAYALGYTGLGVASSRFGGEVMLDLLHDRRSVASQTEFVRSKPLPFPPEPFRFLGIQATRWSLDREDRTGKRNAWLRILDRLGLGFDS